MKKIYVLGVSLTDAQSEQLKTIGEIIAIDSVESVDDLVVKTKDADVIFSDGDYLLESLPKLKNVFVTYPYVELGSFDSQELAQNGVYVANAQGGNKNSVAEWVMFMVLSLFRKFNPMVRAKESFTFKLEETLEDKKVLILGHGCIGKRIGELCQCFSMEVSYFDKGDDLAMLSKEADIVINALNCNPSTNKILDQKFFGGMKQGSYFIAFNRQFTYDLDALIAVINDGIIAGAAIDCDPEDYGDVTNDFYKKALSCEKILVTPHVAFSTKQASQRGKEITVQNIVSYLAGKPQNIIEK